jgi:hypothetical protein
MHVWVVPMVEAIRGWEKVWTGDLGGLGSGAAGEIAPVFNQEA